MSGADRRVPVGVIFSTSGPYGTIGRELRDGALLGVEVANEEAAGALILEPRIVDPGGSLDAYRAATELLLGEGIRHIVGCYTSSSRKEIIPSVEKFDGLLWYPSHYEGFESCPNVIYTGATANQHVVPLANWALPRYGGQVYCAGSNYIWAWENTRIMRDLVQAGGGTILRERYLPVGSTDVGFMMREIEDLAPDFVFNTLIGESCYAFYRAYHELARRDRRFAPGNRPILSCTLSEPELLEIGFEAAAGHISSNVYFHALERPENAAFVRAFRTRVGACRVTSADSEAAYIAVRLLAASLREAGTDQFSAVKRAVYRHRLAAPQGTVWIDPENNHAWLTPRIGLATTEGAFDVQWEASEPYRPDPYLAFPPQQVAVVNGARRRGAPNLRIVRCP
jgi:branched-chain amino acid transport system substrate-binding protein